MPTTLEHKPLGHFLLARGLVSADRLERVLEEQRLANHQKLIGELLVEKEFCTEEQVAAALAESYDVPFARVGPRLTDPRAVALLPREFVEKHHVLPMFLIEGTLTVAVAEPANMFLVEEIERVSGYPAQVVAATPRDIDATLTAYLPGARVFAIEELIEDANVKVVPRRAEPAAGANVGPNFTAGESQVARLVDHVIHQAVRDSAAEIHVEPGDDTLRIRYRIDGRLAEKMRPPAAMHGPIAARLKSMAGIEPTDHRSPRDGDVRLLVDGRTVDLRISTMPGKWGEKIVARVLDQEKVAGSLEKLGFDYDTLKRWRKLIAQPNGLLVVAGPGGSGKTATLYASLHEIGSEETNICTLEDPVFGHLAGANQFQVDEKSGFTFPEGLRSMLRQYPDVVMVGETRDPETAKLATQAAMTGHLVFTTLHTNDAPSAITRWMNLGVEPYLVGASLGGVLSQRLVRKLCQSCKEAYPPTITERRQMEKCGAAPEEALYRPTGCPRCRGRGYHGRVGVYELLVMTDELVERLNRGGGLVDVRELAAKQGMKTLRVDGVQKVRAGITTLEEVYRVTA